MKDPKDHQQKDLAYRALRRGDLESALVKFEEASRAEPSDARTWLRVAEIQMRLGNRQAAVEAYRQAARIHTAQGFHKHAIAIYKNILTVVPVDIDAHRALARLFAAEGLLSDASTQYECVIRACQVADRSAEAMEALRSIMQLNPDDVRIQLRFVDLAAELGLREEALQTLRRAAHLLKSCGRIDEYLRVAERLLREEPRNMALARDIAKGYIVRGNGRLAIARLKMCFDTEPQDAETLDLLAQAFELAGKRAKAVTLLKALGYVHRDQGRITESQDAFHRALDLDPTDEDAQRMVDRGDTTARKRVSTMEIPIEVELPPDPEPAETPAGHDVPDGVPEEVTLRTHMPNFVTSEELRGVGVESDSGVFDLFSVADARRLVAACQRSVDKAAARLQKLVAVLPSQLASRALLEQALEHLTPGSELVAELALLAQGLERNDWVWEMNADEAPTTDPGAAPRRAGAPNEESTLPDAPTGSSHGDP
jgi:tetratricopeptide (TPR) repeat protein